MDRSYYLAVALVAVCSCSIVGGEPANRPVEKNPAIKPLSPEESMKHIKLPPGFRLELVLSEPQIREPVALTWDGNGRMFVAEMRGYMQDIEANGARDPVGRISLHEDTDGDGRMDTHAVYLDGLVEPRAILAVDDGLLVGEPSDLWYCRDTDGDGEADTKELVFDKFSMRSSNVEHKANGLTWGIDNWIHVSQHGHRYQFINRKFRNEKVPVVGQWGLTRNDEGRFLFSSNGTPAIGLFVPPRYHQSDPERQIRRGPMAGAVRRMGDYQSVWPAMVTPDLQAGPGWARPSDGSLRSFTSACGQTFFRGDRLGEGISGDYFVCEPVGRLVRRTKAHYPDSGHVELTNVYEKDLGEFITATDGNFRPVNLYTGPDGCLYIVDMYHGIIQEKAFITPYLRSEILKAGYEKNIKRGRIYRVVREGVTPGPRPRLLDAAPTELVIALAHPNGWWRDMAQSLLVTRQDQSVGPPLREMAVKHEHPLARLHALWTLDGLGQLDDDTTFALTKDRDLRIRAAAVRTMEAALVNRNPAAHYRRLDDMVGDPSIHVIAQIVLTASQVDNKEVRNLIASCIAKHPMSERVFHAVAAAAPRERLADYLESILAHSVFRRDPLNEVADAQLNRWQEFCIAGTVADGSPEAFEKLLSITAKAEASRSLSMLRAISSAISSRKQKPPRAMLVQFVAKPEGLVALEKRSEPEIREQLKRISSSFTWPGLPTYGHDSTRQDSPLNAQERAYFEKGKVIYQELCTSCHAPDGRGLKGPEGKGLLAPPLPGSPRLEQNREAAIQVMLHGLIGELDGKKYEGLMAPFGASNDDEWVASVLTYVRREWGNSGSAIKPSDVASVREKFKDRKTPWTQAELNWKLLRTK